MQTMNIKLFLTNESMSESHFLRPSFQSESTTPQNIGPGDVDRSKTPMVNIPVAVCTVVVATLRERPYRSYPNANVAANATEAANQKEATLTARLRRRAVTDSVMPFFAVVRRASKHAHRTGRGNT